MTNCKRPTRIDTVRSLLRRPAGAGLEEICKTTGWQKHSARAALGTLRKKGTRIDCRPAEAAGAPATSHLTDVAEDAS